MSGLILNLDLSCSGQPSSENIRTKPAGSLKHQRFIKKRKFLEHKGWLRDKQNGCRKIQGPKKLNQGLQPMQNERKHTSTSTLTHPETPVLKPTSSQSTAPKSTSKSIAPKPTHFITESQQSSSRAAPVASDFLKTSSQSKRSEDSAVTSSQNLTTFSSTMSSVVPASLCPPVSVKAPPFGNPIKYLALDCEMVGTGPKGCLSELARCSIVSYDGDVVYDKYIMPTSPVTDFRTRWSGIRKHHLRNATPFPQAKKEIVKILAGKVVVGHAIYNDFKSLRYCHPASLTRDTSRIPLLNKMAGFPDRQAVSLKRLAKSLLNQDIQVGNKGHSSVEDAKTTMQLYKAVEEEWERTLAFISEAR